MKITLLNPEGDHLTATEIKAIKYILEQGGMSGTTKSKKYSIQKVNDIYKVRIATHDTYTIGRGAEWRDRIVKVKIT